jgi:hypothetical protein
MEAAGKHSKTIIKLDILYDLMIECLEQTTEEGLMHKERLMILSLNIKILINALTSMLEKMDKIMKYPVAIGNFNGVFNYFRSAAEFACSLEEQMPPDYQVFIEDLKYMMDSMENDQYIEIDGLLDTILLPLVIRWYRNKKFEARRQNWPRYFIYDRKVLHLVLHMYYHHDEYKDLELDDEGLAGLIYGEMRAWIMRDDRSTRLRDDQKDRFSEVESADEGTEENKRRDYE